MHSSRAPDANPQASAQKSFVIRVRKLDGQNVSMQGSLPSDANLQDLADEFSRLGHAPAGSFGIALPGTTPVTKYVPRFFQLYFLTFFVLLFL